MPATQKPNDLFVQNGWYLEVPGLISPHFETLEGLGRASNDVEIVDGGTNLKHKFSSQILDSPELTLTRTYQGNAVDIALRELVKNMILNGLRIDISAVKLHHQEEVFRVLLFDFRFKAENYPNFDVNSEEKFLVSYGATCSHWEII